MLDPLADIRASIRSVWSTSPVRAAALCFVAYLLLRGWGTHVERYTRELAEEITGD